MTATWNNVANLKGTPGTAASLPNDITGNSVVVAPVSGDSAAVQIAVKDANGNFLGYLDATGKLTAVGAVIKGNETVSGTLTVSGATTLAALSVSSLTNAGLGVAAGLQSSVLGSAANPSISFTGQTDTGFYLATQSTTAAVLGITVNGTSVVTYKQGGVSMAGTLAVSGATTLAALTASSLTVTGNTSLGSTSTGALTPTSLAVTNNATVGGTLGVTGATTLAAVSASSATVSGTASVSGALTANGGVTFKDGTSQTTAYVQSGSTGLTRAVIGPFTFSGSFSAATQLTYGVTNYWTPPKNCYIESINWHQNGATANATAILQTQTPFGASASTIYNSGAQTGGSTNNTYNLALGTAYPLTPSLALSWTMNYASSGTYKIQGWVNVVWTA